MPDASDQPSYKRHHRPAHHRLSHHGFLALAFVCAGGTAQAAVTISSAATLNMNCSAGVCAPTAENAMLNVNDLEDMLASGDVEVTTTGLGVQADNIMFKAPVSWSNTSTLALDAYGSIRIGRRLSVESLGGLSLATNDGGRSGALSFGPNGRITFANLSSSLVINGKSYTLEGTVQSLADAISVNRQGYYAFANSYDAKRDGTYTTSPVATPLVGRFIGLGNSISNLSVKGQRDVYVGGLFQQIEPEAHVRDIAVEKVNLGSPSEDADVGGLAAINSGNISNCRVTGQVTGSKFDSIGGLVGENVGTINRAYSAARVTSGRYLSLSDVGGLVGHNLGTIHASFATGEIVYGSNQGGLVGTNSGSGTIVNSYATGAIAGDLYAYLGGLVGWNESVDKSTIRHSYSTGYAIRGRKWQIRRRCLRRLYRGKLGQRTR